MKHLSFAALLFLVGCASNPYKEFYNDNTEGKELNTLNVIVTGLEPKVISGNNPDEDYKKMIEDGFAMIGYSSFTAGGIDQNDAVKFARDLKADIVIIYSKFLNTVSGSMPISTPTTQTTYSTANATAYGSNGTYANAYGSGTSTTYGNQTNYVPFSVNRYNHGAQYWIKAKPPIFGVTYKDLSEEKRQEISSNKGVEIEIVIKNSPAFIADFLVGDIIKKMNDIEINQKEDFSNAITTLAGQKVSVELLRNGKNIKKTVTMNSR